MERNKKIRDTLAFCLGILLAGGLIQAAGWLKGDRLVFPAVDEILRAFIRLMGSGKTWRMIGTTLIHLGEALLVSAVIGTVLGLIQGRSRFAHTLFRPLMILLRSVPMIVMTVIIMVLTRYEQVPLIATSLMLIPLISEATFEGFRRIDPELVDVYRMNSGFTPRVLFQVYLPLMAGYLKQAYVNAVGMGIKLAVTTEYLVQARDSLGKAIYSSSYFNDYEEVYAYALIMILMAVLVSELPKAAGKLAETIGNKRTIRG
jgi:NitT/TauT family transport system permease protein